MMNPVAAVAAAANTFFQIRINMLAWKSLTKEMNATKQKGLLMIFFQTTHKVDDVACNRLLQALLSLLLLIMPEKTVGMATCCHHQHFIFFCFWQEF